MWLDPGFPRAFDTFLAGRPWTGPLPDAEFLKMATADPGPVAGVLTYHAARELAAAGLEPPSLPIGADLLLPIAAAVLLQQAPFGPKGMNELAAALTQLALQLELPRNLAEHALCLLVARQLRAGSGQDPTGSQLASLSPWASLENDPHRLDAVAAHQAGAFLRQHVLPAAARGRFPLRRLLLQRLIHSAGEMGPLPGLAAFAPLLLSLSTGADPATGHHLADFFESYSGWLESCGPVDAHLRLINKRLELRDPESPQRQEGEAAGRFFLILARLDPTITRQNPRLHRDLLKRSRDLAQRLEPAT